MTVGSSAAAALSPEPGRTVFVELGFRTHSSRFDRFDAGGSPSPPQPRCRNLGFGRRPFAGGHRSRRRHTRPEGAAPVPSSRRNREVTPTLSFGSKNPMKTGEGHGRRLDAGWRRSRSDRGHGARRRSERQGRFAEWRGNPGLRPMRGRDPCGPAYRHARGDHLCALSVGSRQSHRPLNDQSSGEQGQPIEIDRTPVLERHDRRPVSDTDRPDPCRV